MEGIVAPTQAALARGVHHVGITVSSMERALDFYGRLFGAKPEFIQSDEGEELSRTVQLPDAKLRYAFVPAGNTILELLEYERPVGDHLRPRNCDVGLLHVCLEVDDIDAAYERLRELGAEFSVEPLLLDGPLTGHKCCYFRDPLDGVQFELWQCP